MRYLLFFFLYPTLITGSLIANSSNPPNGYHGETASCRSCHSTYALNSGSGILAISGMPSGYIPGQTYNLSVALSDPSSTAYGFQLTAKANGSTSGALSTASSAMGLESGAIEHRGTSVSGSWNFQWTAPATNEGEVSFYASGVATNGNGMSTGDYVYTTVQNLTASSFSHASMEWNASTNGVVYSSPAIGTDGSVYIGSNDNKLHAFNSDGTIKWTFTAGNWVDSSPAIATDGTIYVGSWDNKLYALNPEDGSKIWEYETNSYVIASPAIGADGKIYVGSKDSIFYALESNGSVAWEYFAGQPISSSAALGQDGTIYFGDDNGSLHAVSPDGSSKWVYQVDKVADSNSSILSSPALDLSGNIYFGSGNGYCYSIADQESNASLNWSYLTGDRVDASPVLGMNDEIFFASRDGYFRSLSTISGVLNWEEFVGDVFYSSPVVDLNGRVYVIGYTGGGENHLSVFEANGTKAWDTNASDSPFGINGIVDSSLMLSDEGKLYYGCYDGSLYCLDIGVEPATSDWPMFKRNDRRDGAWPSYTLEILVAAAEGEVSGAGIYNPGSSASISAIPQTGYSFAYWSGSGPVDPNASATTISMTEDRNITAVFDQNSYQLSASIAPANSAEITGTGTYTHGASATLSFSSISPGYIFESWSGDATGSDTPLSLIVTESKTVTANFGLIDLELNVTADPGGSVTGGGLIQYGTTSPITATPEEGYSFMGWSGAGINDSISASTTVEMTEAREVHAIFSLNSYSLTVSTSGEGTATGTGTYNHGDLANITATPATGYSFGGWNGNGVTDANALSTSISMTANTSVSAIFELNAYNLSLSAGTGGTVSESGTHTFGSVVAIEATSNEGYSFNSWYGGTVEDESSFQTNVTINQNISLSALFEINQYTLSASTPTGGTISGTGQYSYGTIVTVNAIPQSNYIFSHWIGENLEDINASSTKMVLDQDYEIAAIFEEKPVEQKSIIVTSSPSSAGTTTGSGAFAVGTLTSITATPLEGYQFSYWEGQSISDSNASTTSVILDSDQNITAHFSALSYTITIASDTGGTVTGEGYYPHGSTISISALAEDGYKFYQWSGTDIPNPLLDSFSVEATQDLNLTANFSLNTYTVTLSQNIEGGKVLGGGTFPHGSTALLEATPSNGFQFLNWTKGGSILGTNKALSVDILMDSNITANFEKLVATKIEGVNPLGDEWYGADWLGYFYSAGTDWSYHLDLGWLYMIPNEDGSMWAWSPQLDWLWLSPSTFPQSLVWSRNESDWIFFSFQSAGGAQIYHYKNGNWSSFDPNTQVSLEDSIF